MVSSYVRRLRIIKKVPRVKLCGASHGEKLGDRK
jgi:hypothetical protein